MEEFFIVKLNGHINGYLSDSNGKNRQRYKYPINQTHFKPIYTHFSTITKFVSKDNVINIPVSGSNKYQKIVILKKPKFNTAKNIMCMELGLVHRDKKDLNKIDIKKFNVTTIGLNSDEYQGTISHLAICYKTFKIIKHGDIPNTAIKNLVKYFFEKFGDPEPFELSSLVSKAKIIISTDLKKEFWEKLKSNKKSLKHLDFTISVTNPDFTGKSEKDVINSKAKKLGGLGELLTTIINEKGNKEAFVSQNIPIKSVKIAIDLNSDFEEADIQQYSETLAGELLRLENSNTLSSASILTEEENDDLGEKYLFRGDRKRIRIEDFTEEKLIKELEENRND